MLTLNVKEMEIVASKFEITVQDLQEMINENNIAIFRNYEKFFYWIHQECTRDELIKCLYEGNSKIDYAEYHVLEDGKTVFMYQ
ncbi:hypothetical protein [Bacillus phage vB_BanS-Thrax5]|nr:hypothetical protein [Bacillus phage vB_BanS-Thrax5]